MKKFYKSFLWLFLFPIACSAQKSSTTFVTDSVLYNNYTINTTLRVDSNVIKMLQPYSDSLKKSMNIVIGFSNATLYKKQPESALGNFMADCMKIMAEKKFHTHVDAAFINNGGIRSYLPKGNITIGNVYEIMPFDNLIVLLQIKGNVLQEFLNLQAEAGGWPVAGIRIKIKSKKVQEAFINNQPLDVNATYTIAVSDYIANGGDNCTMLKGLPVININYLYRDALIEYISSFTKEGKPINAQIENRVSYVL
jgi:2',3'-cyclic-nucleotide 2'-phosphodiesterase (5'-nucleotidase family)